MVQGEQPDFILLNNDLTDGGLEGLSARVCFLVHKWDGIREKVTAF